LSFRIPIFPIKVKLLHSAQTVSFHTAVSWSDSNSASLDPNSAGMPVARGMNRGIESEGRALPCAVQSVEPNDSQLIARICMAVLRKAGAFDSTLAVRIWTATS
jgi:hypothetical protein